MVLISWALVLMVFGNRVRLHHRCHHRDRDQLSYRDYRDFHSSSEAILEPCPYLLNTRTSWPVWLPLGSVRLWAQDLLAKRPEVIGRRVCPWSEGTHVAYTSVWNLGVREIHALAQSFRQGIAGSICLPGRFPGSFHLWVSFEGQQHLGGGPPPPKDLSSPPDQDSQIL